MATPGGPEAQAPTQAPTQAPGLPPAEAAARLAWIGVDWGTSHLRAWGFDAQGEVLLSVRGDAGMGGLERAGFEPALLAAIGPWLAPGRKMPVVACGMVGSRQGWVEAPYRDVPCPPLGGAPALAPATDPRLDVRIIPGLRQRRPHADIMRGEETQIAGFIAANPGFDGILCLPGTHSKWVEVSAGDVVSFVTFMTGETFAALGKHTVLRHSLGAPEAWDDAAFDAALDETLSRPERLARALFSIRADDLVEGLAPGAARARLSGLLIGAELAAARPWWLGREVALIAEDGLSAHYARALGQQGLAPRHHDAGDMTRRGLAAAHALLFTEARP